MKLRLEPPQLPEALQPKLVSQEGEVFRLTLRNYAELETLLAALREAGVAVKDLEVTKPDLEDVFLELVR